MGMLAAWVAPVAGVSPQQSLPRFPAEVVLVPVDVRVVDAKGDPVTDLSADEFTVFENGGRQDIAHFSTRSSPTTGRTFAVVLGRGRLNSPGKALDALIDFVGSRLVPDDRVCVLAYLRATEATTDHEAVVRLLERYRVRHDHIEDALRGDEKRNPVAGLAGPNQLLSQQTRVALESLFDAPGLPATQRLPGTATPLPFNDFTYLMRAIELLRHLEGQKHLVLVAERVPATGKGDFVARKAAAARVTVSVIQTGGLRGLEPTRSTTHASGTYLSAISPLQRLDDSATDTANKRAFADETGGISALYEAADAPLARLAKATRFEYVLGYYPTKPPRGGEYHQLRIVVKRRGVTVLYRHGYEVSAKSDDDPSNVRRIFVRSRIIDAVSLPASAWVPKIPMRIWRPIAQMTASVMQRESGDTAVKVGLAFDPSALALTQKPDQQSKDDAVDVAAFVVDAQNKPVGETWDSLDLAPEWNARVAVKPKELLREVVITVTGRPATVTVAIYEYVTDRIRVARLQLKRAPGSGGTP
jgi:VWFA-related protein